MKRLFTILFLTFSLTVSAASIAPLGGGQGIPPDESWLQKVLRCTWHVSCYQEKKFGSTITTLAATDKLSDSRAVINTNFSNLNADKIENSTTSVAAISTLSGLISAPNLGTLGTATTGIWQATRISTTYGGTGQNFSASTGAISVSSGTMSAGTLSIANGGTANTTAGGAFNALSPMTTAGDIIYGGTAGAGTRLAPGTATQLLHSGTTPSYSAVALGADVTGTLTVANGGTGGTTFTSGDILLGAGTAVFTSTSTLATNKGGTGVGTFTANGVLYGNGSGNIQATGAGTSGFVLTSNGAAAAPTYQAAASGAGASITIGQAGWSGLPIVFATTTYASVNATDTTDSNGQNLCGGQNYTLAQSSTEANARLITSVTVKVSKTGSPTADLVLALATVSGSFAGTTTQEIASTTILASDITGTPTNITRPFWPAVYIPQREKIWLVIRPNIPNNCGTLYTLERDTGAGYANGTAEGQAEGGGWSDLSVDLTFTLTDIGVTAGYGYVATAAATTTATSTIGVLSGTVATNTAGTVLSNGISTGWIGLTAGQYLMMQNNPNATSSAQTGFQRVLGWVISSTTVMLNNFFTR